MIFIRVTPYLALLLIGLAEKVLFLVLHLGLENLGALLDLLVEHLHVGVLLLGDGSRVGHASRQGLRRHHGGGHG